MKKWLFLLLAFVWLSSSCGTLLESREACMEREQREARMVREKVSAADFRISIERMLPLRGMSRSVSNYSVTVKEGKINSYLPYVGEVWRVPYGGGHGLNFEGEVTGYSVAEVKAGNYEVRVSVREDEDEHLYLFHIFDNGRATLDVQSRNRDRISYSGQVDFYSE